LRRLLVKVKTRYRDVSTATLIINLPQSLWPGGQLTTSTR
jgi:hypothetical protein